MWVCTNLPSGFIAIKVGEVEVGTGIHRNGIILPAIILYILGINVHYLFMKDLCRQGFRECHTIW